jgi:hypothetical protein
MVRIDELRTLQRENLEADEKFWAGLQDPDAKRAGGSLNYYQDGGGEHIEEPLAPGGA